MRHAVQTCTQTSRHFTAAMTSVTFTPRGASHIGRRKLSSTSYPCRRRPPKPLQSPAAGTRPPPPAGGPLEPPTPQPESQMCCSSCTHSKHAPGEKKRRQRNHMHTAASVGPTRTHMETREGQSGVVRTTSVFTLRFTGVTPAVRVCFHNRLRSDLKAWLHQRLPHSSALFIAWR